MYEYVVTINAGMIKLSKKNVVLSCEYVCSKDFDSYNKLQCMKKQEEHGQLLFCTNITFTICSLHRKLWPGKNIYLT